MEYLAMNFNSIEGNNDRLILFDANATLVDGVGNIDRTFALRGTNISGLENSLNPCMKSSYCKIYTVVQHLFLKK